MISVVLALALLAAPPAGQPAAAPPPPEQHDFVIKDFQFRSGETLPELRMHYRTYGTPRKDASGVVRNAVLDHARHGGNRRTVRRSRPSPASCSGRGSCWTSSKYYVILPDDIGHGKSSKPSDGLHAKFPRYGYLDMIEARTPAAHRRPGREPPAARDGHVDGRDAHVALGRALPGFHGRADAAREPADPDLRAQPRLAPGRHRRDPPRSRMEERRLHDGSRRACGPPPRCCGSSAAIRSCARGRRRRWPRPTRSSTSTSRQLHEARRRERHPLRPRSVARLRSGSGPGEDHRAAAGDQFGRRSRQSARSSAFSSARSSACRRGAP